MKRKALALRTRFIVESIIHNYSLLRFGPSRTISDKAEMLARFIDDFSELYVVNPRVHRFLDLDKWVTTYMFFRRHSGRCDRVGFVQT